jgi:heme/copper-type cytochrome/quinol oxidase subunit 1
MRAPGLSANRTPLFVWAVYITAFFIVIIITSFSWCYYNAFNWS